ncbi:radical SAM protein [bacterium]|nr:radical SAM protein [bacterium]
MKTTQQIHEYHLWNKLSKHRSLVSFNIELTARCNNNCHHCYINLPAGDTRAIEKELSRLEINRIADEAVELGALWCLLTGGEPLLRNDFSQIYLDLKKKGLLVSVFTNATLINTEIVQLFKQYPPRAVEVSVYGITAETYEEVTRKQGTFIAFQNGLKLLLDAGIKVRFKAMSLKSNYHEMQRIAEFCRSRSDDVFRFDPFLHLRYDLNEKRNKEIITQRLTPSQIIALERSDIERTDSVKKLCNQQQNATENTTASNLIFNCGIGKHDFTLGWDGTFRLCSALQHPECVYDLRKGNLKDAWLNFAPKVLNMRREPNSIDDCYNCRLVNLCSWCPAHSYLENGSLVTPIKDFCESAHARNKAFGVIDHQTSEHEEI